MDVSLHIAVSINVCLFVNSILYLSIVFRFRNLVAQYELQHEDLEIDVDAELKKYKVSLVISLLVFPFR